MTSLVPGSDFHGVPVWRCYLSPLTDMFEHNTELIQLFHKLRNKYCKISMFLELSTETSFCIKCILRNCFVILLDFRQPLWCGQSSWLQMHSSQVRFLALSDFLSGSGPVTGSTHHLRINEELLEKKSSISGIENWD
jgi:hypothetical protein